ncbi:LPXTG cell wall anchor domain-containing protein [Companilactobacillus sp. DQM5]|uniref:LPXTG cell wall anchor domain-containing protein n=1 Tax=Companilactobacillus sp. DQM5 TaxID=3463359 RepID=UPI00405850BA
MKLYKKISLVVLTLVSGLMFSISSVNAATTSGDNGTSAGSVGFYGNPTPPDNNKPGKGEDNDGNNDVVVTKPSAPVANINGKKTLPLTGTQNSEYLVLIGLLILVITIFTITKKEGINYEN